MEVGVQQLVPAMLLQLSNFKHGSTNGGAAVCSTHKEGMSDQNVLQQPTPGHWLSTAAFGIPVQSL